jgi:DNA-damage-inducible protein J
MVYVRCNEVVHTLILNNQERPMAKTATIQTRVDPEIKRNAQKILSTLNISMSEAISIYLTQITLNKGIPFEIKIPNKLTARTLKESENRKELHKVSDVDELFQELNS